MVQYPVSVNTWTTNNTSLTNSAVLYFDNTLSPIASTPVPRPAEGPALEEDPLAWLRRRVAEVQWSPE